jgi:hypothetical protein
LTQQTQLATIIQRTGRDPGSLSPRDVLQLQRTIGNQAAGRLLAETIQRQPTTLQRFTGIKNNQLIYKDEVIGQVDDARINCLGYASGVGSSVQFGNTSLKKALKALGFNCKVTSTCKYLERYVLVFERFPC